jgi:ParB family chromosome partitioning protein
MNEPKSRGLGRGLSALLDEYPEQAIPPTIETKRGPGPQEIALDLIRPNPNQPRRRFDDAELAELAASIAAQGVLQPILVRPAGEERFEIVAGERRWRAAQRAGLHAIPALVRALDDVQVAEIALIENVQRADLNAIEEARAYQQLIERFGRTQASVGEAVGKSRAHIANLLRLLALPEAVQDLVRTGALSAGHARAALSADDPEAAARHFVEKGLSVREAERHVSSARQIEKAVKGLKAPKDADTEALEGDLSAALGLPVAIRTDGKSGTLAITWRSLDQLDDLCRRLTRFGG